MSHSEFIIINQARLGSEEAFRQIVQHHKDSAYTLAKTYVRDSMLAEDIVQEAFISAFLNLKSFRGKSKFSTWLYRIVVNECFRQAKLREKYGANGDKAAEIPLNHDSPQDQLEKKDQLFYMQKAMELLKPNEALAIRLFHLEELKIAEIAKITGWSKSNIKVLIHRGRSNLRIILENYIDKELITLEK